MCWCSKPRTTPGSIAARAPAAWLSFSSTRKRFRHNPPHKEEDSMSSVAGAPAVPATPAYHPTLLLIGRILLAAVFLVAGVRKLMAVAGTVGYFTKLGMPMPDVMIWLAVIIEIG